VTSFLAVLRKEFQLLIRDIHGLALMFAMPVVFIIIMSLAMQGNYDIRSGAKLNVLVEDLASNGDSELFLENLSRMEAFDFLLQDSTLSVELIKEKIQRDEGAFLISIDALEDDGEDINTLGVRLLVAPATNKQLEAIFVSGLQETLRGLKVQQMLADMEDSVFAAEESVESIAAVKMDVEYAYEGGSNIPPSAVQQSVPAWLVFAMFFVVVPLSNTLIKERDFGTLRRLRTIDISSAFLVLGKLVPYFFIMQLQVVAMILVGMYIVPLLGGESFTPGDSYSALVAISFAVSFAALGYASLIAVAARTTEQATTLGGAGNIILAAIGGIMVPSFMMPAVMQKIGAFSPMSWGLEGFLDVFLRNGDLSFVWPKVLGLSVFGLILLLLALFLMAREK